MSYRRTLRCALLSFALMGISQAADTPFTFENPQHLARYQRLVKELRCLVCQNQNLADSHADLAQDMRNEVYRLITADKDDEAVIAFLVERYGDFVRYRPPVTQTTWLLWFGPFGLLMIAAVVVARILKHQTDAPALSAEDQSRLAQLQAMDDSER